MESLANLKNLALSETGFVFDPCSGAMFTTNAAGREIIEALRDGLGREETAKRMALKFDLDGHDQYQDIDEFVEVLRANSILPKDFTIE